MQIEEYRKDPCRALSIPWWKNKGLTVPEQVRIVHEEEFRAEDWPGYRDERYFRLICREKKAEPVCPEGVRLRTAEEGDLPQIAEILERCYPGMTADTADLAAWREEPVFEPQLWIMAEETDGTAMGCGLGVWDRESGEGSLEWIQVLPEYRRRGIGSLLVNGLLFRMAGADFVTVSGKADDPNCPEGLYRRCGFDGTDLWHILTED